jgi:hypothetical protein
MLVLNLILGKLRKRDLFFFFNINNQIIISFVNRKVELLIKAGANVNNTIGSGKTA